MKKAAGLRETRAPTSRSARQPPTRPTLPPPMSMMPADIYQWGSLLPVAGCQSPVASVGGQAGHLQLLATGDSQRQDTRRECAAKNDEPDDEIGNWTPFPSGQPLTGQLQCPCWPPLDHQAGRKRSEWKLRKVLPIRRARPWLVVPLFSLSLCCCLALVQLAACSSQLATCNSGLSARAEDKNGLSSCSLAKSRQRVSPTSSTRRTTRTASLLVCPLALGPTFA